MSIGKIYNIDMQSDETFLATSNNLMIIAAIFSQAVSKHVSIYNKKEVPLSFLEFYFEQIKNYGYMFRKQTKEFFESYDRVMPNFNLIAEIYVKSYFAQASSLSNFHGERCLILNSLIINDYIDDMIENSDKDIVSAITNIKKITEHINNSDEIIPFHKIYENYMISKAIKLSEFNKKYYGKSKVILNIYNNDEKSHLVSATKRAERLTSERINISSQKGRVTKIVIPRLKLPTAYPKTTGFNRFNSNYKAHNFVSASRMILILNDLKINGVAYSNNFVEKRKAMNEQA